MIQPRSRPALWIVALLTALMGVVNLVSAVTPSLHGRVRWLEQFYPFAVRAGGHIFAAVAGFMLLTLSLNLLRRKRVAWVLTVALLILSILSHLIKGLDYEESLLAIALLGLLVLMRKEFTAQSDRPSIGQGVRVLVGALLFTLAYGTIGFYVLDRHYSVNFNAVNFSWSGAFAQTLAMFFTADNAGLTPTTRYGRFFANSIYLIGAITIGIALLLLLRPVLVRSTSSVTDQQKAKALVEQYGETSLAHMALFDDKVYYFSPSGCSVIAYVVKGRGAIALGDPIGAKDDRSEAILGFREFCGRNDWYPAFYQTLPDDLPLYQSLGFQAIKIGAEAIVDLQSFKLSGKSKQNLRTANNKLTREGYSVEFYQPPISRELLAELRPISDEWLQNTSGSEKKFSVGWFNEADLRRTDIAIVRSPDGTISAFANIAPEYQRSEVAIDLMRKREPIASGTMDFLFVALLQHYKERGFETFNLGMSALTGVGDSENSPRLERGLRYLSAHLTQFYNFQGLHHYKEKFEPQWEPRYLVYPGITALPDVVVALVRADSGDRLMDYLKPGL